MEQLVIGILAHVDAGKTTLSEGLLYRTGAVRKLGRVDHQDAFLDTNHLERERGITIFSKQAVFPLGERTVTLLDTPGHVDFSAEMERTLQVLDYAILVISGTDGVQGHTRTLWRLLQKRGIPTFLFINKMDLAGADQEAVLRQLQTTLDAGCLDFGGGLAPLQEDLASLDEGLMERYLSGGTVTAADAAQLIARRQVFPCYFGSALKLEGVDALLEGLAQYALTPSYPADFAARVFKIARDGSERLTYLKVTGGSLKVRTLLSGGEGEAGWQEKVNQIRVYSGEKYQTIEEAEAGTVCAVTGLTHTRPGDALGAEQPGEEPVLEPVLTYRVELPEAYDAHTMLKNLRQLEEEDPQLRVVWNEAHGEIQVQLMGEVQLEVLHRLIAERFGVEVAFGTGSIVYRETIAAPVLGVGHFEPLRHYAEVHLLLEPGERGSGLRFASLCGADDLDPGWQRLILTHLMEKRHVGVLTGSAITDMKISLLAGRAHVKHTEGGDFRQATYRAVRQGLMGAESVLLEPWYSFRLEVPQENLGRAMSDVQTMGGEFESPELLEDMAVLTGAAPVSEMGGYWTQVAAYSKGHGHLFCTVEGYRPCHNAAEVIAAIGYDAERDTENPADSVFCSHGAGTVVKWSEVPAHAHVTPRLKLERPAAEGEETAPSYTGRGIAGDKELEAIFVRTYGPIRNRGMDALGQSRNRRLFPVDGQTHLTYVQKDDCLVVDGYNIIFAWDELKKLAQTSLDDARQALIHLLSNYRGIKGCKLILVFDAYRVKGGTGKSERVNGIDVVFTKEGETADSYIEKLSYDLGRKHRMKVATSDNLERVLVLGHGAQRLSAVELKWEVEQVHLQIQEFLKQQNQ